MSDGICVVDLERKQSEEASSVNASSCKPKEDEEGPLTTATREPSAKVSSPIPGAMKEEENCSVAMESFTTAASSLSLTEFCKICHCGAEPSMPLIAPCFCDGSLKYVHQECLQRWIKSSDIKRCELCKYLYIMQSKVKPFCQWEKLDMSSVEKRKLLCSIMFHIVAITCVIWSLYVLINRTAEEIKDGNLYWPFWTKLIVVAIGFTGGLVFMYIQCRVYVHLCKKWKAYNRIIVIQDIPEYTLKPKIKKLSMSLPVVPPPSASAEMEAYSPVRSQEDLTSPGIPLSPPTTGGGRRISASRERLPLSSEFNGPSHQKYAIGNASLSSSAPDISSKINKVSSPPPSSAKPGASKSNAETQTALRGVSLLRVLRDSSESEESPDLRAVSKILIDDSAHTSIFIANSEETRGVEELGISGSSNLLLPGQSSEEEVDNPSRPKGSESMTNN